MKKALLIALILVLPCQIFAVDRYVDNAATGANNGTSWADAWTTLPTSGLSAGDTLYISGGTTSKTYTGSSWAVPSGITVKPGQASPHNGVVILYGIQVNVGGTANVTISGNDGLGNRHIQIVQQQITNLALTCTNLTIEYVEIRDFEEAIKILHSTGTEVRYCYLHGIPGVLSGVSGVIRVQSNYAGTGYGTIARIHHNEIAPNGTFTGSGDGPDGIEGSDSVDVYNNHIYGVDGVVTGEGTGVQHQDGVQAQGRYWRIYNNFIENMGNSCLEVGGGHSYLLIYNNVMAVTD